MILEESEKLDGRRVATVVDSRGYEVLVDVDAAVLAVANIISDQRHEQAMGWSLELGWYREQICRLEPLVRRG